MTNARVGTRESGVGSRENTTHGSLLPAHRIHHYQPTALAATREREPARNFGQDQEPLSKFAEDVDEQCHAWVSAGVAERVDKELALLRKETESNLQDKLEEAHRPRWRKAFGA